MCAGREREAVGPGEGEGTVQLARQRLIIRSQRRSRRHTGWLVGFGGSREDPLTYTERERERKRCVCVCVCVCMRERDREVCVCVCVCVRERERECVCV